MPVDLGGASREDVEAVAEVAVVAVEDQRLAEEGAQGQLGRRSGRRTGGGG